MLSCKAGPGLGSLGDSNISHLFWESPFLKSRPSYLTFLDIISRKAKEVTKEIMTSDSIGSKKGNINIKVDNELGKVSF